MYNEITIAAKWWKDHFLKYDETNSSTTTHNTNNDYNNSSNNTFATPSKNWRSQLPPSSSALQQSAVVTPIKKKNDLLTIFESEFIKELTRHYQGHWYEDDPLRGSAYRAITYDHRLDTLFIKIGQQLDMNQQKMEQALISARFSVMFINPGQVKVANLALTNTPPISLYEADNTCSTYYDQPTTTSSMPTASAWSPFSAVNNKSFLPPLSKDPNEEKTNDENKNYSNNNQTNTNINNNFDMKPKSLTSVNNSRWASAVSSDNGNNNTNRSSNNGSKSSPYLATFSPTAPLSPASPSNLSMNLNNHQSLDMSADVIAIS